MDAKHPEAVKFQNFMASQGDIVYTQATQMILEQNLAGAVDLLSKTIRLYPHDIRLLLLRASVHRTLKQLDLAMKNIENAAKWDRQKHAGKCCLHICAKTPHSLLGTLNSTAITDDGWGTTDEREAYSEDPKITRQRNLTLFDIGLHHLANRKFAEGINVLNRVIEIEMPRFTAKSNVKGRGVSFLCIAVCEDVSSISSTSGTLTYHVYREAATDLPQQPMEELQAQPLHDQKKGSKFSTLSSMLPEETATGHAANCRRRWQIIIARLSYPLTIRVYYKRSIRGQ